MFRQKTIQPVGNIPMGWTIDTYAYYQEQLRQADLRFGEERDRRNVEGAALNAVALKIKETADHAALTLASESQARREAQNDAMRDKQLGESGIYATNASVTKAFDTLNAELKVTLQPLVDFVAKAQGGTDRTKQLWAALGGTVALFTLILAALAIFVL